MRTTKDSVDAVEYYRDLLKPLYQDRKFIVVSEVDAGLRGTVALLKEFGAQNPLLVAGNRGTSTAPLDESLKLIMLGVEGDNIVDSNRLFAQTLLSLAEPHQKVIDDWDPSFEARWVCYAQLVELEYIGNRLKYGRRKPAWTELEDKTTIDRLWDKIGIARAPSRVESARGTNVKAWVRKLDEGLGTVWAPDNLQGVQGGAVTLRWVQSGEESGVAANDVLQRCDYVRIMPFLEGVPVSIHGIVFPSGVAVFRPVELVVLRNRKHSGFVWGGCATGYDPAPGDRKAMRAIARKTGDYLRTEIGFRGPFSIDGILTAGGFRPTELNPRLSGGFIPQLAGLPALPLAPLCWAAMEDEVLDYRPDLLEDAVVEAADDQRSLRCHTITTKRIHERTEIRLKRIEDEFHIADESDRVDAELTVGPSPVGGIVMFEPKPHDKTSNGRIAPKFVDALRFCDIHVGTNFGHLEAADDVRGSSSV